MICHDLDLEWCSDQLVGLLLFQFWLCKAIRLQCYYWGQNLSLCLANFRMLGLNMQVFTVIRIFQHLVSILPSRYNYSLFNHEAHWHSMHLTDFISWRLLKFLACWSPPSFILTIWFGGGTLLWFGGAKKGWLGGLEWCSSLVRGGVAFWFGVGMGLVFSY